MTDITLLVFALTGKLLLFLAQKFPPIRDTKDKFLHELTSCNLCFGTWIYFALAGFFHVVLFRDLFYCPVVSELATGAIISFVVHLVSIGWNSLFQIIRVE